MKNNYQILLFIIIFIIFGLCITKLSKFTYSKLDKKFYNISEVCPELNTIYSNLDPIKKEIETNLNEQSTEQVTEQSTEQWKDWPEKNLYNESDKTWKIIPFKALDLEVEHNCKKYPKLWEFIQSIPNVRIALLSKLGPGMKIKPHQGWGTISNNGLRCHFGINVPINNKCYVAVADKVNDEIQEYEKQYHSQDSWLVFDDSKFHYAHNPTKLDRIVLIMDIERPPHIKTGLSKVEDTKELTDIINSFKKDE